VQLLTYPEQAQAMGASGLSFVKKYFSFKYVCEQWCKLFEDLRCDVSDTTVSTIRGAYPFATLKRINSRIHSSALNSLSNLVDIAHGRILRQY
jgi:hypothetical protein